MIIAENNSGRVARCHPPHADGNGDKAKSVRRIWLEQASSAGMPSVPFSLDTGFVGLSVIAVSVLFLPKVLGWPRKPSRFVFCRRKAGTMFSGKLCFLHGQGKEVCLYAKASQKEQACHHCSQEIPDSACNGLGHLHGPLYFWESKSPVSARFLNRAINLAITALPSRTAMNTSIA